MLPNPNPFNFSSLYPWCVELLSKITPSVATLGLYGEFNLKNHHLLRWDLFEIIKETEFQIEIRKDDTFHQSNLFHVLSWGRELTQE